MKSGIGRRKIRYLLLTSGFFYIVAAANDRMAMYLLAWLLVSLIVVGWGMARFGATGIAVRRRALPDRLTAGQPLSLGFELRNLGSFPKSGLLLTDRLQNRTQDEKSERTLLVATLAGASSLQVETDSPPARRGMAVLGPVAVTSGDPLGLFEIDLDLPETRLEILVHPRLVPVRSDLPAGGAGYDEGRRGRAPSGLELHSLREYQPGDDLRHVHWKASARQGRLLVKEYERPTSARGVVLLDLDARQVFGHGLRCSLEAAVTAAGSVLAMLVAQGRPARLVAHESELIDQEMHEGGLLPLELLDTLALVRGRGQISASALLAQQLDRIGPGDTLVVVTAASDPQLLAELRRLADVGRGIWLILLDAEQFAAGESQALPPTWRQAHEAAAWLTGGALRVTVVGPDDDLGQLLSAGVTADGAAGVAA